MWSKGLVRMIDVESVEYEVANVKLGGVLGKNPTLLIGTIFYRGDKLLGKEDGTCIDKNRAKIEVEDAMRLSENLGLQFGLDVVFPSVESVDYILPFMVEFENLLLFLDSPNPKARVKAYQRSRELGVEDRVVANGIYPEMEVEEVNAIRESKIKAGLLLAFDPRNPYYSLKPESKLELLKGMLETCKAAALEKPIVDVVVLDPGSIGLAVKSLELVKREYKLPTGCAPANALGGVSKKLFSEVGASGIHSGVASLLRCYGADFIMYGPVRRIRYVAYAIATIDSILAVMSGVRVSKYRHPLNNFFKNIQKTFVSLGW